jgi:predicted AAA+ superfamily ATPase
MSNLRRYLQTPILEDLEEKMVFLGGPRQVGKTTLSTTLPHLKTSYLNWDNLEDKKKILNVNWPELNKLIVFDEVHKFARWRNMIKGYWDIHKSQHQFLVTGSARLDYYRKGGDSLLGRYHYYRLHPLSLGEISKNPKSKDLELLLKFGGFPEPFLKGSERTLRRWHLERNSRVITEDIKELERIKEMSLIELLMNALPQRVGSPLSKNNLAHGLEVDFKTIERWLTILESVYYCYRISPFGPPKLRAVKKEQKVYLWDWSEILLEGPRWENFVGSYLLKYCHFLEDTQGYKMELRFLRDTEGREIDFVVLKDKLPLFAVECKSGEKQISKNLEYFKARTSIPAFYQVHRGTKEYSLNPKIHLMPFLKFCEIFPIIYK